MTCRDCFACLLPGKEEGGWIDREADFLFFALIAIGRDVMKKVLSLLHTKNIKQRRNRKMKDSFSFSVVVLFPFFVIL